MTRTALNTPRVDFSKGLTYRYRSPRKGGVRMRPRMLVLVWPLLAHAVAWAAFLWLVFYPFAYRGVSVQAAPAGSDAAPVVTNVSASFFETNGWWVALYLLIPVVLTGLGVPSSLVLEFQALGQECISVGLGDPCPRVLRWGLSFLRMALFAGGFSFGNHGRCLHVPGASSRRSRWSNST